MNASKSLVAISLALSTAIFPSAIAAETTSIRAAGPAQTTVINTIRSGVGTPAKTLGNNGDFYIDTKSLFLYGPKTKGVWKVTTSLRPKEASVVTPIVGAAGAEGATGATGPQGDKGDRGAAGEKGDKGDKGATGDRGTAGANGAAGFTGATGATGSIGATGSVGSTGLIGATGLKGDTGTAGTNGSVGATGATGATGPAGAQGPAGSTGGTGLKGDQGAPGATGPAGEAGISSVKFATVPITTLGTGTDGNTASNIFFTASSDGHYTFEILVSGVISIPNQMKLYAEIVSGGMVLGNQFAIASDSTSAVNGLNGRQYGFRVIGSAANVTSGTTFSLRLGILNAVDSINIVFMGRALVNKVGSIG